MIRKLVLSLPLLFVAFFVFVVSVYNASSIEYKFTHSAPKSSSSTLILDRNIVVAPTLLPGQPVWVIKAFWDKARVITSHDPYNRTKLLLSLNQERLGASVALFEKGKAGIGMATLAKAQKYLEQAWLEQEGVREGGGNTAFVLQSIAKTAQVNLNTMDYLLTICPEEACPKISEAANLPQRLNEKVQITLSSLSNIPTRAHID